ncbi:MAG: hypothetical protein RQ745_09230 [Longimicrobiales bacterium]|nr:hypothetical protein [Longimicrobiales bacterium]
MSLRTNPDRILENIDRRRNRDDEMRGERQAAGRELDTEVPAVDATTPERLKRIFATIERAYVKAAQSQMLGPIAQRFQAIGDLNEHRARGDVSVAVRYLDHDRPEDFGMAPLNIYPEDLEEARKESKTSRPDINAMRVLRRELRKGVITAYQKVEPRLRDAMRDRADMGHIEVQVTIDLRSLGDAI